MKFFITVLFYVLPFIMLAQQNEEKNSNSINQNQQNGFELKTIDITGLDFIENIQDVFKTIYEIL